MLEPRRQADLLEETIPADAGGECGVEDLEGDRPVVAEVLGEVDGGHAAAAELALDVVAVEQRGVQREERIGSRQREGERVQLMYQAGSDEPNERGARVGPPP
jgi:hypothetical protein